MSRWDAWCWDHCLVAGSNVSKVQQIYNESLLCTIRRTSPQSCYSSHKRDLYDTCREAVRYIRLAFVQTEYALDMPKARQTCTRCSMRRQKCDRQEPCTRCVQAGEAGSCSRVWREGYDARIHRSYPKPRTTMPQSVATTSLPGIFQNSRSITRNDRHEMQEHVRLSGKRSDKNVGRQRSPSPVSLAAVPRNLNAKVIDSMILSIAELDSSSHCATIETTHRSDRLGGVCENCLSNATSISHLEGLLPSIAQVRQLVEYYERHLLWYLGCVCGPLFRRELNDALKDNGYLPLRNLDLRWCALLYAILGASITCAREAIVISWGFTVGQKCSLSRKWYEAAHLCLDLAHWTARPHINSVQAIQVLSMSAHDLDLSHEQFVMFGAALRISQSLGLQKLPYHAEMDAVSDVSMRRDLLLRRETGRRVWLQMCVQDWFSVVSTEMYSINPKHVTTSKPLRLDDDRVMLASSRQPLVSDYLSYISDVAALLAEFYNSIALVTDPGSKYEEVLKYDARMRAIGPAAMHASFLSNDVDPWVRWARGIATVVHSNKTLMIHRSFFGQSFADATYAYSRWASVTASKAIIGQIEAAFTDPTRPFLWSDQSHIIGASITLCLDLIYRSKENSEFFEGCRLVDRAIYFLNNYRGSKLSSRGARLLSALLKGGKRYSTRNESDTQPPELQSVARPLEGGHDMQSMLTSEAYHRPGGGVMTDPLVADGSYTAGSASNTSFASQEQHHNVTDAGASLEGYSDPLSDTSWMDLFSQYFPPGGEFATSFLTDDFLAESQKEDW